MRPLLSDFIGDFKYEM